ncbi:MAG: RNA ligase family protein [Verrucomicrobiota bacterium]
MKEYHKIQTVFKRDPDTKFKSLLEGGYSLPEFAFLAQNQWVYTEKVDGTNIRIQWTGTDVRFEGKTDQAQLPSPLVRRLQDLFLPQKERFQNQFPEGNVCFYGEGYGPKIQKVGSLYRQDQDFVLFDIRIGPWWLQRPDIEAIASKFGLRVVPILGEGTLPQLVDQVRTGFDSTWGAFPAEGIVARPKLELTSRNGSRIITKLKHRDFLHNT